MARTPGLAGALSHLATELLNLHHVPNWSTDEVTDMQAEKMISTHPDVRGSLSQPLVRCIEECYDCAQGVHELC